MHFNPSHFILCIYIGKINIGPVLFNKRITMIPDVITFKLTPDLIYFNYV